MDEEGHVTLWVWDAEQQVVAERSMPAEDAAFLHAAQMVRLLARTEPEQETYRVLQLVMALEAAKRQEGYDRTLLASSVPALAEAAQAGAAVLEKGLALALRKKLHGAAAATIDALAETHDASLVQSTDGQPRLLVQALLSPHRRVQFAAARAILKLIRPAPTRAAVTCPKCWVTSWPAAGNDAC